MDKNFWKDKKVLITGDTGFKGAWLTLVLSSFGAKIQGLSSSKFSSNNEFYDALQINKISRTVDLDVRDLTGILKVCKDFKPEIIFHLAAQPLVRESYLDPVTTYDVNVMGTLNMLEAVRNTDSAKAAVMITTDKCYENNEWEWGYREIDPMGGHDPYSSSKGCAEILIQSYQKSFFNSISSPGVSSVRAGNVIGGGDFSKDRLIPDLYRAITSEQNLLLRNPNATRPWQHVLEPLSGYMAVAQELYISGASGNNAWNFGPHITDIRSVQKVSELFCSAWGCRDILEYESINNLPHEAGSLSLDISKAFFQLRWSPQWTLEQAVEKTANLYKEYFDGGDCLSKCAVQIDEYFDE
jgi:CDP-glucose 4,6-dehydratase